jgi:hypothetical protein
MRKRKWTEYQLKKAVKNSTSLRQVLHKLELKEAGGNYTQIKKYIKEYSLSTKHFKGKGWRKGLTFAFRPKIPLKKILIK